MALHCGIKAEALAVQELGDAVFANVIFLGALSSRLALLSPDHILDAIRDRLPSRFYEKNVLAFELGRSIR
jgi:2-oxoglutarate ferredoxin oxidoreductase subunit gamma